jgi:hypothetical protein
MASKSWTSAVRLTLVVWALASCAREGPALEQGPQAGTVQDTFACRDEEEELSEEELAELVEQMEQIDPKRYAALTQEFKPVAEALSEHFSELWKQTARPGTPEETSEERRGTFTAFQTTASTAPGFFGEIEESGHDMSPERSCRQLVPTKVVIEPDCRPIWYFFCWREPGLDLLSAYRQDAAGWVKADTRQRSRRKAPDGL